MVARLFRATLFLASLAPWPAMGKGAAAQVSPGPLARPHRDLEGSLKCTGCHARGRTGMAERCVACHRDIGWLAARGRGWHGSSSVRDRSCATCHPDHAGIEFELVQWPEGAPERFDHKRAGWALEQSHRKVECTACHAESNRRSPAAALAANGRSRWTGLESACGTCHDDAHRGALGDSCGTCHDAGKWAVTPGFSHDTTRYPLTGRHASVPCDQCHLDPRLVNRRDSSGRPVPVYRPVPHESCASCHRDVHGGRFGAACATCHSTRSFQQISGTGFDHQQTAFPLAGRHRLTPCSGCHRDFSSEAGRRPASSSCGACHADPHAGQATVQDQAVDCRTCHDERGFVPSTFTLARHQESGYPLEGRHQSVSCGSCHRRDRSPDGAARWGPSRVIIRPPAAGCGDCHSDPHGTALAGTAASTGCAGCHGLAGWKPSTFDRVEHQTTALPLDGRHAEIDCRACHGADRKGLPPPPDVARLGRAGFAFRGLGPGCASCHVDPHGGRLAGAGSRPGPKGCLGCHTATAFAPAMVGPESHETFRFPLAGAHRAVACASCHDDLRSPPVHPGRSTLIEAAGRFPILSFEAPATCAACHRTVHGAQFDRRPDGGRCDACHGEAAFVPAVRFDHDRDAAFPLQGAHQRVACEGCHRRDPAAGGTAGVIYRPVPSRCDDCHR